MTIDSETLAAFAQGELPPEDAARVEAAIAADPDLAAQLAAHRALAAQLQAHFAPAAAAPLPDRLTAPLRTSKPVERAAAPAEIVDLAQARAAREAKRKAEASKPGLGKSRWVLGGGIAAALVLGIALTTQAPDRAPIASVGGQLVAQGPLENALNRQLASAQGDGPVRILLSFKANDGRYCRGFQTGGTAGIACHGADSWDVLRTQATSGTETGAYRQAGSADAAILAAAQDMADGPALDAAAEKAALDAGWRR